MSETFEVNAVRGLQDLWDYVRAQGNETAEEAVRGRVAHIPGSPAHATLGERHDLLGTGDGDLVVQVEFPL